jgi:hypothetical protein
MLPCVYSGRKEKRFSNAANSNTTFLMDTFLQSLIDDLQTLATEGVKAVRWDEGHLLPSTMKAHLLLVMGDMPTQSKVRISTNTYTNGH